MPRPSAPIGGRDFTGVTRLRRTLFGRLVLQVEEQRDVYDHALGPAGTTWRDARASDLWRIRSTREHLRMDGLL